MFNNKNVLVTGATGMIGRELCQKLLTLNANVTATSFDKILPNTKLPPYLNKYIHGDLRNKDFCNEVVKDQEIVFHVAGIKGSPLMATTKPYTFLSNTLEFNLNIMNASFNNQVKHFLYTSSVGVYSPAETMHEDSVWETFPSKNDKFAGWAKRIGELQLEAANLEYQFKNTYVVRPANVYGRHDNFNPKTAMIIPSLIARLKQGERPLKIWGDGSAIRDFIHASDVASSMLFVMENGIHEPVNIGSGKGISIFEIAEIFKKLVPGLDIEWDPSMPTGDLKRVLDMTRLFAAGFKNNVTLLDGIQDTLNWYLKNTDANFERYDAFLEKK